LHRTWLTLLALAIAFSTSLARQDDAKQAAKPSGLKEEIQKLHKEMEDFGEKLSKEFQSAKEKKDKDEQEKIRDRFMKGLGDFVARVFDLAEKIAKDEHAVDAVLFGIGSDPTGKAIDRGVTILIRDHAAGAVIGKRLEALAESNQPKMADVFRAVIDKNADKNVQGSACLGLALHLMARADTITERAETEQLDKEAQATLKAEAEQLTKEAEAALATAVAKYADAKTATGTVGAEAKTILGLIIGKAALDIEGNDTDGKDFKLSDYKGKVVLIDFWASWCGPCMRLVPHNLALIKKMEGKPFAIVGVNLDEDKGKAKKAIADAQITWRSFHDDGGKIGKTWRVSAIPALFVIDAKGIMRHKWVGASNPKAIDEAIEALVKEAEKEGAK
jgi:thiol-disulfide isomerase/thioredoxin